MSSSGPDRLPQRVRIHGSLFRSAVGLVLTALCVACGNTTAFAAAVAPIVINEIMYHPPNDRDELQWVEVHNAGSHAADLSGWAFTKGIQFRFPAGTLLPEGGFVVVCRNQPAFTAHYGREVAVVGEFTGRLSHSGETLELADAAGAFADRVIYGDAEPWPRSPDGMSASLERITPAARGDVPDHWAPSALPELKSAAGTPGRRNSTFLDALPPGFSDMRFSTPEPGVPLKVQIGVAGGTDAEVREVRLEFQTFSERQFGIDATQRGWDKVPMAPEASQKSGNPGTRTYHATLPAQPEGTLVRFRVVAIDGSGRQRIHPHPHDARPSWTVFVGSNTNTAQIPFLSLIDLGAQEAQGMSLYTGHRPGRSNRPADLEPPEPARGRSAVVWMPPRGREIEVLDYVRITPRKAGWKVRLQKDRMLEQMSTVNIIFEARPRQVLSEHLAYELYREAGVAAPLSGHWRIWHNGEPLGYHLFVEQPNSSFLRRTSRDDSGDLFKLLWYGQGIIGQHEKKNNPATGHEHLVGIINGLRQSRGRDQWELIQRHFNVDQFASYYAVNMCLQNWDGFFNNYFVYRSPGAEGKWEIIPWDEDKTWGDFDGASAEYDWYTMPLTMGMNGDRPSRSLFNLMGGGPFGGSAWWRPPGWMSGPLLANPEFRRRFLLRLREICQQNFTVERWEVPLTRLERRLEPEVQYRAALGVRSQDTADAAMNQALSQFRRHMGSFRKQVEHRRRFILEALEKEL